MESDIIQNQIVKSAYWPLKVSNKISSVIISSREDHSKKPDEVRNKIVELCGDVPRIELFARQKIKGWDAWGNEISN